MVILGIVLAVLGLVALTQLVRVFELTGKLRGNNQDKVEFKSNRTNGQLWLLFGIAYFAFFLWLVLAYGEHLLPEAASEHGAVTDAVLNFNFIIIIIAFVITHILLFYFASKYYWRPNRKADFITHNNKLELVWTTFPAIFLAVIIIYGLSAWNDITSDPPSNAITIELYSKQFDWTARYSGVDSTLGASDVHFISGMNPLGVITPETIESRQEEIQADMEKIRGALAEAPEGGAKEEELMDKLKHRQFQYSKINAYERRHEQQPMTQGDDDKLVKGEFHIPVNHPVNFIFRSQDVIHSAYMPHFRLQMNTVPGTPTYFHMVPTITTEEMRQKTGNPDFKYLLYCNKICGAAHYNMQMEIVVESMEDYQKWLAEQMPFTSVETAQNRQQKASENLALIQAQ